MGLITYRENLNSCAAHDFGPANCDNSTKSDVLQPFTFQSNLSKFQYYKMIFLSFIILPVRLVAVGLSFSLVMLLAKILTLNYQFKFQEKPDNTRTRRVLLPVIRIVARAVYFFGGFHWVTFKGKRASRTEAPILVIAPHSSYMDSLVLVALGLPSHVGKYETAKSFMGPVTNMLQPILVNREDPNSRKNALEELNFRARSKDDWPQIAIFPEGTCTNRSCITSFKPGAFYPSVPVQPVVVRWPNKVDSVTWVCEGPSVLKLLWMTLTQFHNRLEIEFLPVYTPRDKELTDARLYGENVRRLMANRLKIPTCDLSYNDFRKMQIALNCHLPGPEGIIHLHSLLPTLLRYPKRCASDWSVENDSHHDLSLNRCLNDLISDARSQPYLHPDEFVQTFYRNGQPASKEVYILNLLIKHYTDEASEYVNFRKCVIQACMLHFANSPDKGLRSAFKICNPVKVNNRSPSTDFWPISLPDAKQLVCNAFEFAKPEHVSKVISIASTQTIDNNFVTADDLYNSLMSECPTILDSYNLYNTELCTVQGTATSTTKNTLCLAPQSKSISSMGKDRSVDNATINPLKFTCSTSCIQPDIGLQDLAYMDSVDVENTNNQLYHRTNRSYAIPVE